MRQHPKLPRCPHCGFPVRWHSEQLAAAHAAIVINTTNLNYLAILKARQDVKESQMEKTQCPSE